MIYNSQTTQSGHQMPLLMGFSTPQPIDIEETFSYISYNPFSQSTEYDMRVVGTKCLKTSITYKITINRSVGRNSRATGTDKKNEIDDSKNV